MVYGVALSSSQSPTIASNTVLKVSFDGPVPEKTDNVAGTAAGPISIAQDALGLRRIKRLIEHAATDDKISGILIQDNEVSMGQATINSIRESLEKFKAEGKFIYAYADYMSQSSYYLSSVADSIFLNPQGMVDLKGFATLTPFFKEMLNDIGVEMEVFYAGDFKSATEPFRRKQMSPENKLQTKEFLNEMLSIYQANIAQSRGLSVAEVNSIMDEYKGRTPKSSLASGLIDKIAYIDEVESTIKEKLGVKPKKNIRYKSITEYNDLTKLPVETGKDKVAVLFAEGTVNYGTDAKGEINEKVYTKFLNKIQHDDNIKALVLRVNSGGGSSLTSDIIWRGIENVKKAGKPVIASFGDYAASGGYYIACGADSIVAEPTTLTGSIGVFTMFPNVSNLMNDKLGIYFDTVKTNTMALGLSPMYDLSKKEEVLVKETVDEIYETFLTRVADGRGMTKEEVHKIAQGRVWTGQKGKEIGLVDVLGSLEDAIQIAAEAAGLDAYKVKEYPYYKTTFLEQFMKEAAKGQNVSLGLESKLTEKEKSLLRDMKSLSSIYTDRTPQARLPFILEFD